MEFVGFRLCAKHHYFPMCRVINVHRFSNMPKRVCMCLPTQMYIISVAIVFAQQYAYYLQFPGKMHNK